MLSCHNRVIVLTHQPCMYSLSHPLETKAPGSISLDSIYPDFPSARLNLDALDACSGRSVRVPAGQMFGGCWAGECSGLTLNPFCSTENVERNVSMDPVCCVRPRCFHARSQQGHKQQSQYKLHITQLIRGNAYFREFQKSPLISKWMSEELPGTVGPLTSAHLHIQVFSHSVDPDSMESSVRQVTGGGAEHVRTPVCLKVVPDLQTPWTQSMKRRLRNPHLSLRLAPLTLKSYHAFSGDKKINVFTEIMWLPIYTQTATSELLNCLFRSVSGSSRLPHRVSQYVLNVPPTQVISTRSQSHNDTHCQEQRGQYYNSRSVGEGVCAVIHSKSSECSSRWRSLRIKSLICPTVFTETWGTQVLGFNTKECIKTLTRTITCTHGVTQHDSPV